VRIKREALVRRDATTIQEALRALERKLPSRAWYVLEGESCPDACLETDTLMLVVEGKRTERGSTTTTRWMPTRNQLLRHMDAALEIAGSRSVLGLQIVEGPDGKDGVEPEAHWLNEASNLRSDQALADSLPHRSIEVRHLLRDGFLGVTTWQRVCTEFGIPWPPDVKS